MRRLTHARGAAAERGAAAVEFALVLMLLIPMMFGIVDYGLWFADSLAVRHGVHEAARVGVVQTPGCATGATALAKMVCTTKEKVGAVGGPTYAMVKVPQGWARGKPLLVCAMVKENGVTGVTPLPSGRLVRAKAELAIEVDTPVPSGASATAAASASDTAPAGADWAWCA
jgi:Flp pilus assembly protein TadG